MITPEAILARLREKPFRPLRIIVTEGLRFDIYHPDLVFVGRHDLQIGFSNSGDLPIYDRVTRVAMLHVVALEDLPVVAGKGNGQHQGTDQ